MLSHVNYGSITDNYYYNYYFIIISSSSSSSSNIIIIIDVAVDVIASFNKMKAFTSDLNLITQAIQKSTLLEVSICVIVIIIRETKSKDILFDVEITLKYNYIIHKIICNEQL